VLLLDEPANGLDPAGMARLRGLLRDLADEGRTILVSSHHLSEVAQTVDQVVIINKAGCGSPAGWTTSATWRPPSCASPTPTTNL
jgi:ABC-2 type transport system ATP-binding protein